jgi:arsenate reductase-like glutaredoxin family protein
VNIQIFGKSKCFDTKKAERYFKERRIKYQYVDILRYGMSMGELKSVAAALGGAEKLLDESHPDAVLVKYLAHEQDKLLKLFERPELIKTPVVRNGRLATAGNAPEVWKSWE